AKKFRDHAQEAFKVSCGPNYDKVKRLRENMEDPSLFGILCGMFLGVVALGLIISMIDPSFNPNHPPLVFLSDGIVGLTVACVVGGLIHYPFWQTKQKKITAQLQQLGVQPTGPSEKWEDYLDQVKIEVVEG
ncbi:MAG: hypothetical protein NT041_00070, partial [Candidatus Vogelbacteria bacterium]|nr:hypothetical protein [Candidatus Vogelbacteria bacterium]